MAIVAVAILGALIPTAGYVLLLWWIDRYEKEPVGLLAVAFLWGAGPAAILSIILEVAFALPLSTLGTESLVGRLLSASVGAPLIEESAKGIALIFLLLVVPKAFDGVLDGIVFGAMIGFGFAMTEDIVAYFVPIMSQHGLGAGLINIFLRTVVFGFNHAFWTGLLGASVGYARLVRSQKRRLLALLIGGLLAVVMHSLHNVGATLVERTVFLSLGFSALVDWSGVLALGILIALDLRTERRWIETRAERRSAARSTEPPGVRPAVLGQASLAGSLAGAAPGWAAGRPGGGALLPDRHAFGLRQAAPADIGRRGEQPGRDRATTAASWPSAGLRPGRGYGRPDREWTERAEVTVRCLTSGVDSVTIYAAGHRRGIDPAALVF